MAGMAQTFHCIAKALLLTAVSVQSTHAGPIKVAVVQTVIVLFTSYLLLYALGVDWPLPRMAALLMVVCAGLLAVGRYKALDLSIKILVGLLTLSTVVAAVAVAPRVDPGTLFVWPGTLVEQGLPFAFLLALMGWMPSALISVLCHVIPDRRSRIAP